MKIKLSVPLIMMILLLFVLLSWLIIGTGTTNILSYHYITNLEALNSPEWNTADAIQLGPHEAVSTAREYLKAKYPSIEKWDIESITLLKDKTGKYWWYLLILVDRGSGDYKTARLQVLLDGRVYEAKEEKGSREGVRVPAFNQGLF